MTDWRLLYLAGFDLPMPHARVVQSLNTARALAAFGCRVTVAVGRAPRHALRSCLAGYGVAPHPNLRILSLPTLRLRQLPIRDYLHPRLAAWNWSYGLAALAASRLLPAGWEPNLVLARDPRLAWLFHRARAVGAPRYLYEVHELFSTRARERDPAAPAWAPRTRLPRLLGLERGVLRGAAALLTLTSVCKELVVSEFGVPETRVAVAADAVGHVPNDLPPLPNSHEVVYAGQLYPWKGVGTLVRAVATVPGATLRIVGGLPNERHYEQALRDTVTQLGSGDRVTFAGFVPHRDVPRAIANGAAAAVPLPETPMSRYFTSPLKVFEYMAAGLPIVASDLPALRDVLHHEVNALLVPPDDVGALGLAIERLLRDRGLAERLRAQALADVRRYTWAARAETIVGLLDREIGGADQRQDGGSA
ncbi:MAG: glycosyltransferase family 4 protein [Chloroflexi bacterium]|nr:glycosyltransferase family 4 protein [Chloroflexota bacterium]